MPAETPGNHDVLSLLMTSGSDDEGFYDILYAAKEEVRIWIATHDNTKDEINCIFVAAKEISRDAKYSAYCLKRYMRLAILLL